MPSLDPRTWFAPLGRPLVVQRGQVVCPNRGDVDVEICLACGHMVALRSGRNGAVICSYRADDTAEVYVRRGA